jgi:hypothetical protein
MASAESPWFRAPESIELSGFVGRVDRIVRTVSDRRRRRRDRSQIARRTPDARVAEASNERR